MKRINKTPAPARSEQWQGSMPAEFKPQRSEIGNQEAQGILRGAALKRQASVSKSGDAEEMEASALASEGAGSRAAKAVPKSGLTPGVRQEEGRPLQPATRHALEAHLGADLSNVRVQDSEAARATAAAMGARAFALQSDVWLGPGERESDTALMAHELAHVLQHGADPNPRAMRQTVAGMLPSGVSLDRVGLSFELPGGKALTGSWNDLSTTNPTTVSLAVTPTGLTVSFSPPLLIDAQWPVSDIEWSGVQYSFATASISSIGLTSTQTLAAEGGHGSASGQITSFFTSLLAGTAMATAGYDPLTDPDIGATLSQIRTNFTSAPSSGGNVTPADVSAITLSASVSLATPMSQGTPEGTLEVSGSATISARIRGTAATLESMPPEIEWVRISGSSIVVQQRGEPVARLDQLTIHPGGSVSIDRLTLLVSAAEAADTERGLRGLGLLLLLSAGGPNDRLALSNANPNLDAEIVPGIARSTIERALTDAVRQLIIDNAGVIPGYDLAQIFSVQRPQSPPGDYNRFLPGETENQRFG